MDFYVWLWLFACELCLLPFVFSELRRLRRLRRDLRQWVADDRRYLADLKARGLA